jgi:hypothetical protein
MADIHAVISLGLGSPGDIEHFTLVGLNANPASISPATGSNLVTVAARDRVAVVPRRDRVVNLKS